MKKLLLIFACVGTLTCMAQTTELELRWNAHPFTPYIDFSNDASIDFDARFILLDNDQVGFFGSDLRLYEGSLIISGVDKGLSVGGGGGMPFIKLAGGNPFFQVVTNFPDRNRSMFINAWGNSSNPGITVGTTRNEGVAFNVVRNVTIDGNGLPTTQGDLLVTVLANGNMGVGTDAPDAKLAVNGQVHATEVRVTTTVPGPDYVFEKSYDLPTLPELKKYIDANQHLPEIPSAKEMATNGLNLGEMDMLLLKKIEELTLYILQLKEESAEQQKLIDGLIRDRK